MLTGRGVLLEFFYLATISHRTRECMAQYLSCGGWLPSEGADYLATSTLSHIEDMRSGFRWSLRASEAGLEELRYLLQGYGPLEGEEEPPRHSIVIPPEVLRQVQALRHAQVVFGIMPSLPQEQVAFPYHKSYADVSPPRGMAELSDRIVELERGVWDTAMLKPPDSTDWGTFRKVFGFFDAATWLATGQGRLFGQRPGPSA